MELLREPTLFVPKIAPADKTETKVRSFSVASRRTLIALTMAILLGAGTFLRLYPSAGYQKLGPDEHAYMVYLTQIERAGIWNYDSVVKMDVARQYELREAVVPATRMGFLIPATLCAQLFHLGAFAALHATAAAAGILTLLLASLFSYRLGGSARMLSVTALMAAAPLQVYLCQRAGIDGYFAFWALAALYLYWENLQRPRNTLCLISYAFCLTMMVLTKETAAFVLLALIGLLFANRILRLGTVTPQLVFATILGPAIAFLVLVAMIGSFREWFDFYLMFVAKSRTNFYSVAAQDGPWYRYAIDFALLSPAVVVLALGGIFGLRKIDRPGILMAAFAGLTLASMSCVRYGLSLRYAAFCDLPLAWLACSQILAMSQRVSRIRPAIIAVGLFAIVVSIECNQYVRIFVRGAIYDPITDQLVLSLGMAKSASAVRAQLAAEVAH